MRELLNLSPDYLRSLGILDWGYTEEAVPSSFDKFESWISRDLHGSLTYLSDHRKDIRADLRKVYPNFQSALVFLFSYQEPKKWLLENDQHKVAGYSLGFEGRDYHVVLKERLETIFEKLREVSPELLRFTALDAQPVMERDLAYRSGLGWFGRNSMLINRKEGSYFIIGSLLLNQKLPVEAHAKDVDHCGQCQLCVEACPTLAIDPEARSIVASKCISTYTIEVYKDAEAPAGFENSRGEVFGCDICQDVCPWNRKPLARVTGELKFSKGLEFLEDWFFHAPIAELDKILEAQTNRGLKRKLSGTPFDRPGRQGWLKNLRALKKP